jgi:hypothetical protein
MQQGSPGADLAYFLSASVGPDEVDELIEYYRQGLKNNGIEISRERVRWEYNAGMMSMIHRLTPLFHQNQLEFGDGRGPEVMQIWIDRTFEKLENVDFENLLEQIPQT